MAGKRQQLQLADRLARDAGFESAFEMKQAAAEDPEMRAELAQRLRAIESADRIASLGSLPAHARKAAAVREIQAAAAVLHRQDAEYDPGMADFDVWRKAQMEDDGGAALKARLDELAPGAVETADRAKAEAQAQVTKLANEVSHLAARRGPVVPYPDAELPGRLAHRLEDAARAGKSAREVELEAYREMGRSDPGALAQMHIDGKLTDGEFDKILVAGFQEERGGGINAAELGAMTPEERRGELEETTGERRQAILDSMSKEELEEMLPSQKTRRLCVSEQHEQQSARTKEEMLRDIERIDSGEPRPPAPIGKMVQRKGGWR